MKFALGRKLQMTQLFDENGVVHPVTAVMLEPLKVTLLRTKERDGYDAVQVQYGKQKKEQTAAEGKKKVSHKSVMKNRKEFRVPGEHAVGDQVGTIATFDAGDVVRVSATSKGKGFQGVVKRHGFAGGPRTHGQKHNERQPGSIGSGLRARVPKGTRMAGRMGSDRVTVKGTKVVLVDKDQGLLLLQGSIPGRRGTLVEIQSV